MIVMYIVQLDSAAMVVVVEGVGGGEGGICISWKNISSYK